MENGLQPHCLGKYEPTLAKERQCSICNSLHICIQEQATKPIKKYIRLDKIEDKELQIQLESIRKKLNKMYSGHSSINTSMRCLKYICTSKQKLPNEITIFDISDYLEVYSHNKRSIQPVISTVKTLARDILKLDNWDLIGESYYKPQKAYKKTNYNNSNFINSKLWQDFEKYHNRYIKLRRIKKKSATYSYMRKFIYYCYKNDINEFKFEPILKQVEPFLESQNVEDTSYKLIWQSLKILFESAFDYTKFKYDILSPSSAKPKLKPLPTKEEITALFKYFKMDKDVRFYPLFATICYSSVRIEKISTLTWDIVDLDNRYFRLEGTKTGDRDKEILPNLADILKEYKEIYKKHFPDTNYLFPDINGKIKAISTNMIRDKLVKASKNLGIPYYPPNHYRALICINIWIDSEYNTAKACAFMDHETEETTLQYIRHFRKTDHKVDFQKHIPNYMPESVALTTA